MDNPNNIVDTTSELGRGIRWQKERMNSSEYILAVGYTQWMGDMDHLRSMEELYRLKCNAEHGPMCPFCKVREDYCPCQRGR